VNAVKGISTVRVPKAGEMVAAHLRRQIVLGELKEGDQLPQESILMGQFGVSRPTLREAFKRWWTGTAPWQMTRPPPSPRTRNFIS
jgi:DNA-binding GntR family transcriptional regulator